jgi:hypothetical protein
VRRECDVCGSSIRLGDIEFLVRLPLATTITGVAAHRRCFDLWAREAAIFAADGRP